MAALPDTAPRLSGLGPEELRAAILERIQRYPVDTHPQAIVERALAYPFESPLHSYVLVGRHALPLLGADRLLLDDEPIALPEACARLGVQAPTGDHGERHCVLAYGANGSPRALVRKFVRNAEEARRLVLPVLAGRLDGFDVVYSSHLSAYGSVPATIQPAPGVGVQAFVMLLTDAQLVRLMETEFNYEVRLLEGVSFRGRHAERDELIAFVSRHGALGIDGAPVPLAAIRRVGTASIEPRAEPEQLDRVRAHLRPDEELADFIVRNVRDPRRALGFTYDLRRQRIPFGYERARVLDG